MKLRQKSRVGMLGAIVAAVATLGVVAPAHAETPGRTYDSYRGSVAVHVAFAKQWLDAGSSWYFGNSQLKMQSDGNLVVYHRWVKNANGTPKVLWAAGTNGKGGVKLRFQADGNLVIYKSNGTTAVWASGTYNKCTSFAHSPVLGLQSDGNFVIYCAPVRAAADVDADQFSVLWATNTLS